MSATDPAQDAQDPTQAPPSRPDATDVDDSDTDSEHVAPVQLGFVAAVEPDDEHLMLPRFFPSKFLLQIYAPVEESDHAFHRSVMVFMCAHPECHTRGSARCFRVFRTQLPRSNPFYSSEPPDEDDTSLEIGPQWAEAHARLPDAAQPAFPELEMWMEEEPERNVAAEQTYEKEMELLRRYEAEVAERRGADDGWDEDGFTSLRRPMDPVFVGFSRRISRAPRQCLRYQRGGQPLWCASEDQCEPSRVPHCSNCGSHRVFEFQIMPQLLHYLQPRIASTSGPAPAAAAVAAAAPAPSAASAPEDTTVDLKAPAIDWGVLCVYTCERSCDAHAPVASAYVEEFLWKQAMGR